MRAEKSRAAAAIGSLALLGLMVGMGSAGSRSVQLAEHAPQLDALMVVKLELALAHLELEELLDRDPAAAVEQLERHLDRAERYARAAHEGGETEEYTLSAIRDPQLQQGMAQTLDDIDQVRTLLEERLDDRSVDPGADTTLDGSFWAAHGRLDLTEAVLREQHEREVVQLGWLLGGLGTGTLALFAAGGLVLRRSEVARAEDRRQLAEQKELTQRAEQDARRLEALGRLAGGIAHDFNNALVGVVTNLSVARSGVGPGELDELLDEAAQACDRAVGLTRQLATFSRGGAPKLEVKRLRPLLRRAAQLVDDPRVELELDGDLGAAEVDSVQVVDAVRHLVQNALEASDSDARVRVTATPVTLDEDQVGALPAGRYVRLEVHDSGTGMPPEVLSHAFDPYFSTKASGRGLGLATCHGIAKRHGGHLAAVSEPGRGSVLTLHLPATDAPVRASSAHRGRGQLAGRVLVMDDEPLVARAFARILKRVGLEHQHVEDGQAALDAFDRAREEGRPFDLVVLDLTVPGGMGGQRCVRELLARQPDLRAIVTSGHGARDVLRRPREHGFRAALVKPYSVDEALDVIARVLCEAAPSTRS